MACPDAATEPQSFDYFAFGIRITSDRSLPGLIPSPHHEPADLHVWLDDLPAEFRTASGQAIDPSVSGNQPDKASESWVTVWKYDDYFRLRYKDQTEFSSTGQGRRSGRPGLTISPWPTRRPTCLARS